jgi:guanylate kinase
LLNRQGVLLVVSGPSGVGKGTVIRELLAAHPEVSRSVSCTTRAPRPGEVDGDDYHFISVEEFGRLRSESGFLEWASVHGDLLYGTPREPVLQALARGEDIILEIDYQGARSVRTHLGGRAVLVFIAPPSWEALHNRLVGRETESEADVRRRLNTALAEIAHLDLFEYVVVNDDLAQAVGQLEAILLGERNRLGRLDWRGLQAGLLQEAEADRL